MAEQSPLKNRILSRLSTRDFALLADHLEPFKCPRGLILAEAGERMTFVHFLENGMASVVAQSPEGHEVEAGIIGREGFVHPAVILGSDRIPHQIGMQLAGASHRIVCADLVNAVEVSATLRHTMLLFAQAQTIQSGYTTLSAAVHKVDERLARWLLMCHDRSESDDLALTHEFMGLMLAVRRVTVTDALHTLEGNGFIELARGYVTIHNRTTLEAFAADAYGRPEREYRRLLGPL